MRQPPTAADDVADYAGPEEWLPRKADIVAWPTQSPDKLPKPLKLHWIRPNAILVSLAALVMFLLLLIPAWNAVGLVQDPIFVYMAGSQLAGWLLVCFVFLFLVLYIMLQCILERNLGETGTEHRLLMVAGIFLSTLGILLILFGSPLTHQSLTAAREFTENCRTGDMTQSLFTAQEELQSLRATPGCAKLASIEQCDHFSAFPRMKEAQVLKALETGFQCSGICEHEDKNSDHAYPPTLFSKANYKLSCDGMASRHLRNFNAGVSHLMVAEGCVLVATAIVISLGELIALCIFGGKAKEDRTYNKSYGATL